MRITESQLRRIVRQEILRESAVATNDLQKALEKAGLSVLGGRGGDTGMGGMMGGMGPSVEILGMKPGGNLVSFSVSIPFMGQISQYVLISQDDRGMFMVMPATAEGEIDQAKMKQFGLPPEGFRRMDEMAVWLATNFPKILSGML